MKIITTPDPRLRQKSQKVKIIDASTKKIVDDMVAASLKWEESHPYELSAAMAAPQLGINKRIIIVRNNMEDKDDNGFTALIDPEIIQQNTKTEKDYEGCLSVPALYGLVSRPTKVKIKAKTLDGQEARIKVEGPLARVLQHEIDHLDGILFIDHIKDDKDAFFKMNDQGDLEPVDYSEIAGNKDLFPDD